MAPVRILEHVVVRHPAVLAVADRPVQILDDACLIPMELTQLLKYQPSMVQLLTRVKPGLVGLQTLTAERLLGHVDFVVQLALGVVLVPAQNPSIQSEYTTHS